MRSTYGYLFSLPGTRQLSVAGVIARLPLSMAALGIVLVVSDRTGSYAQAGLVSACYVIAAAVGAPIQGRLSDVIGQRKVLLITGSGFAVGMAATIGAIVNDAATPLPHSAAVVAGLFNPQVGAFVRARWTYLLREERSRLTTAFAVEAILDEVVFVVGPVLVTFLTLQVSQVSGLAVATTAATLGSWWLAAQRSTEPPARTADDTSTAPMGWGVLGPVLVACVAIGVLFGSAEVLAVAFTEEQGQDSLAGLVLAFFAGGSLIAGVIVGALPPPADAVARLRYTVTGLALLFGPLIVAPTSLWVTIGMFAAGFMIAPTMIAAMSVIEENVAPSRLTEALTWTSLGLAVGVAPGAAIVGAVVDEFGASVGFAVPLVAGLAAAVVAWLFKVPERAPA